MFLVGAMEAATNFTVPLYVQIVQGRDAFQTALAMMPLKLAAFFTAILMVRLYPRFTPRQISTCGFAVVAAGSFWLAYVVRNDWSTFPVVLGLISFGVGTGALVTLLFNVLVTSAPKAMSGDVGALRGAAINLSTSVGTALVGALAVGVLSAAVMGRLDMNPVITAELRDQVNLDSINFFSNERLAERLQRTTGHARAGDGSHANQRGGATARAENRLSPPRGRRAARHPAVAPAAGLHSQVKCRGSRWYGLFVMGYVVMSYERMLNMLIGWTLS